MGGEEVHRRRSFVEEMLLELNAMGNEAREVLKRDRWENPCVGQWEQGASWSMILDHRQHVYVQDWKRCRVVSLGQVCL